MNFNNITPAQRERQIRQLRAQNSQKIALRKEQKEGMKYINDSKGLLDGETRHSKLIYFN